MGSLRTPNGGRYPHAKKFCIRVDYHLFQQILGAKFDENNTSAIFTPKTDKLRQAWNGNMTFLFIKCLVLPKLLYVKY